MGAKGSDCCCCRLALTLMNAKPRGAAVSQAAGSGTWDQPPGRGPELNFANSVMPGL